MLYYLTLTQCISLGIAISFVIGGSSIIWRVHTGREAERDLWNFFIHNAPVGLGIVWFGIAPIFAPAEEGGDLDASPEIIEFGNPKDIEQHSDSPLYIDPRNKPPKQLDLDVPFP